MASSSSIKAGAAYIELYTKDSRLVKGLNDAAKRLDAFGKSLQGIGTKMAMLGAGIVTPLAGAAKVFADMGSDMVDMSQRTGVSVAELKRINGLKDADLLQVGQVLRLAPAAHGPGWCGSRPRWH